MKPPRFAYAAPGSLDEAFDVLERHAGETAILAGGQSLLPALNFRLGAPAVVIDINALPGLDAVTVSDGAVRVGALARHTQLATSELLVERCPVLAEAARHIGHTAIRNRGTIGGSLAHADPAAELAGVVAALGGSVELTSRWGTRAVGMDEFVLGPLMTVKQPDELVTGVVLPERPGAAWGFAEVARRPGDFALAGAIVSLHIASGSVADARVGLFGVEPVPRRLSSLESAFAGLEADAVTTGLAGSLAGEELEIADGDRGRSGYRRHLAQVVVDEALAGALARGREAVS